MSAPAILVRDRSQRHVAGIESFTFLADGPDSLPCRRRYVRRVATSLPVVWREAPVVGGTAGRRLAGGVLVNAREADALHYERLWREMENRARILRNVGNLCSSAGVGGMEP